jgi:formylglycine-generating enzyme required for sulfatase activity
MPAPLVQLDRSGFPMLWVEPVEAYLHFVPVTKIQMEIFLCEAPNPEFGDDWYADLLNRNGRVSPRNIKGDNYWQAFVTGILPQEAEAYADWCSEEGGEYALPSHEQWLKAYEYLKAQPIQEAFWKNLDTLTPRAQLLLDKLTGLVEPQYQKSKRPSYLADQMFMRYGVMEWVSLPRGEWGGLGKTDSRFRATLFDPDSGVPEKPHIPIRRMNHYGLRLLKRN